MNFVIENDSGAITSTSYWDTAYAQQGLCYLSGNGEYLRLLVPARIESSVREMQTGRRIVVEPSIVLRGHIDVVFDDETKSPFYVSISPLMLDRQLRRSDVVTSFDVYCQSGKILSRPCRIAL